LQVYWGQSQNSHPFSRTSQVKVKALCPRLYQERYLHQKVKEIIWNYRKYYSSRHSIQSKFFCRLCYWNHFGQWATRQSQSKVNFIFRVIISPKEIKFKHSHIFYRLQNALRRWHPDKFQQWSHGRIENDVDKENILKIVTHVSQILLSYGK